jgi:hypothetical protein
MYIYIHIHIHTYTYTYTCIQTHTHTSICIHIHTYTYTYIPSYTCRKGQVAMWQAPYNVVQDVACLGASNKPEHSLCKTPVLVH